MKATRNLTAVPAGQPDPYHNAGNPLIESSLVDTLHNLKSFAGAIADYQAADCSDGGDYPGKDVRHGRYLMTHMLEDALSRLHDIESGKGGAA